MYNYICAVSASVFLRRLFSFFWGFAGMFFFASCAPQQQDAWVHSTQYVEEIDAPFSCGKAAAGIELFLADREREKMFGGRFVYEDRYIEGECGRFTVFKAFSDSIDAVIALVPLPGEKTKIVIYQRYIENFDKNLGFMIEDLASGRR